MYTVQSQESGHMPEETQGHSKPGYKRHFCWLQITATGEDEEKGMVCEPTCILLIVNWGCRQSILNHHDGHAAVTNAPFQHCLCLSLSCTLFHFSMACCIFVLSLSVCIASCFVLVIHFRFRYMP